MTIKMKVLPYFLPIDLNIEIRIHCAVKNRPDIQILFNEISTTPIYDILPRHQPLQNPSRITLILSTIITSKILIDISHWSYTIQITRPHTQALGRRTLSRAYAAHVTTIFGGSLSSRTRALSPARRKCSPCICTRRSHTFAPGKWTAKECSEGKKRIDSYMGVADI